MSSGAPRFFIHALLLWTGGLGKLRDIRILPAIFMLVAARGLVCARPRWVPAALPTAARAGLARPPSRGFTCSFSLIS